MSYAVRKDGQGFRAIDGPGDVEPHESYCEGEPPVPVALPLSTDEAERQARDTRDQLLAVAANRMGPLQDAVDRKKATAVEVELLGQWKDYRIELNRVGQQKGFPAKIAWPSPPTDATP